MQIEEMLSPDEIGLLKKGDRLNIFLPFKTTKKDVWQGFFRPPVTIDVTYQDTESLKDPTRSDMPAMKKLEALGLVVSRGCDFAYHADGDGTEWRWERTDLGREVIRRLSPQWPKPKPTFRWISDSECEVIP